MHIPGAVSSPVFSSLTENRLMYLTCKPITAISPAAAILCFRLLCAKIFLHMRQNLLDSLRPAVALPPSATVSVQAVQQCRQREQIRDTERRPARRHPHKRIHRRSTGKSLTNAAQHPVITRVMDPSHTLHRPRPARTRVREEDETGASHGSCAPQRIQGVQLNPGSKNARSRQRYVQRRVRRLCIDCGAPSQGASRCPPCARRSWARSDEHRGLPVLPPRVTVIEIATLSANITETPAPLGITVGRWR